MKKLFFFVAFVTMSMLSIAQVNQMVWANGRLLYGTPVESMDSLTYDEMQDVDTLHLLLPRTLIKVIHDTVIEKQIVHDTIVEIVHDTIVKLQTQIVHDTVYIELPCPEEPSTPSAGIGAFSVSADKQVTFSPGNLQYTQSTNTWSFASVQYEVLGTDNVTGGTVSSGQYGDSKSGTALADKIDLFGWSTSATNFGVSTSTNENDYSGSFVDWGTNKIGNDAPNTWRTLTYNEWNYLRNGRPNAASLRGVAQVNGVNGLIFLPDNWTCPAGVTFKSGFHSDWSVEAYGQYQTFSADQWSKLESAGAIFLPVAGDRIGTKVTNVQGYGGYWSATEYNSVSANCLGFSSDGGNVGDFTRDDGWSVRLVKDL